MPAKVQALDEAVVGDALSADGSIDALDPQLAEVALASSLRSREVVVKGVQQLFLGLAIQAGTLATVAGSPLREQRDASLWAFTARLTRAIIYSSAFY